MPPCIKLLSLKRKSRLWIIETSRFKTNPSYFMLTSTWNISILLPTCCFFRVVWMKMQIHSLPLSAAFRANSCFPGNCTQSSTALTNSALSGITGEMKWKLDQSDQSPQISVTQRRVWKNESLSKSFGSRWASKVKINAYYKTMKVFFDLACMSACCWIPKTKIWTFHNP